MKSKKNCEVKETFDRKETNYIGLWYHNKTHDYTSCTIDLAELRKFDGEVTAILKKNLYKQKDDNKPNYFLKFIDTKTEKELKTHIAIKDLDTGNGVWRTTDGERLFTYDEVYGVLHLCVDDIKSGYIDLLPEDYLLYVGKVRV